jgi:hypothetical protein
VIWWHISGSVDFCVCLVGFFGVCRQTSKSEQFPTQTGHLGATWDSMSVQPQWGGQNRWIRRGSLGILMASGNKKTTPKKVVSWPCFLSENQTSEINESFVLDEQE